MQRLALVSLLFLSVACHKELLNTPEVPEQIKVHGYIKNIVGPETLAGLDWSHFTTIESSDGFATYKIPFTGEADEEYNFLIVSILDGKVCGAYKDRVLYEWVMGTRFPAKISNYNYITGEVREYDTRKQIADQSHPANDALLSQLLEQVPMVTFVGPAKESGMEKTKANALAGTNTFILASVLGLESKSGANSLYKIYRKSGVRYYNPLADKNDHSSGSPLIEWEMSTDYE
jgi:hypothetical protein